MTTKKKYHRDGETSGKMSKALANDIIKHPHMYPSADLAKAKKYLNKFK